jgi:beta-glucosidase
MKKIGIIIIACFASVSMTKAQTLPYLDESKPVELRIEDALLRMTLQEKIAIIHAQSKFSSPGIKRLGFPDFWTDDGPHGVRPDVLWDEWEQAGQSNDSCVAFPALTCLAATWNPGLSFLYGESLGEEALYRGKNMILGPGVNIYRTPLNGRNFEYMGEDPYLASKMVVPYIKGMQSKGVAACVKHYALNNNEENRHTTNVIIDDRTLHEIYLPAFKAAVTEGHAWAIMGSYNLYKNQHNCHNSYLLNDVLKRDWKFDGVVVSDWGGTHDTDQAIVNGLDMEFGSWTNGLSEGASNAYDSYYLGLPYLRRIQEGRYTTTELDNKVRRVLRLFYRTTMNTKRPHGFLCSESHYVAARKIADEGIVLLQNKKDVLPINVQKVKRILIVGENAIKMMTVGGGSSSLKVQREVSPLDGLKARLGKSIQIDYARGYIGDTTSNYNGVSTGQTLNDPRSETELIDEAIKKAHQADYVIMFGGLNKSDFQDCEGHDRKSYVLPYAQDKLITALAKSNKNFVYVNISGNAVAMPWASKVPAIIQGWFIGSETGEALADVLTGEANPSGKLPFTWPASLQDVGANKLGNYLGIKRADEDIWDNEYKEGMYVGYRWVDKENTHPLFAFGHGMSYTSFKLSNLRSDKKTMQQDGDITFTVDVKNTGKFDGSETVQLYISDIQSSLPRPQKELKGFKKIHLKAGETTAVSITIDKSALSFYNDKVQKWTAEPGEFIAHLGNSSDNLTLSTRFYLQ